MCLQITLDEKANNSFKHTVVSRGGPRNATLSAYSPLEGPRVDEWWVDKNVFIAKLFKQTITHTWIARNLMCNYLATFVRKFHDFWLYSFENKGASVKPFRCYVCAISRLRKITLINANVSHVTQWKKSNVMGMCFLRIFSWFQDFLQI